MPNNRLIARRYATALLDVALAANAADAVAADMLCLEQATAISADLQRVLHHPGIVFSEKQQALLAILHKAKAPAHTLSINFIGVLQQHDRLTLLHDFSHEYTELLAEQKNILRTFVTTAVSLSPVQQQQLAEVLEKNLGKKIALSLEVNPDLLAGLQIRIGSMFFDASLQTRLFRLEQTMTSTAQA